MMKSIKMNGIKLSNQHILLSQSCRDDSHVIPVHLYQTLSAERINISFLNISFTDNAKSIICCIEPDQHRHSKSYLGRDGSGPHHQLHIGMLSLYPHKFSLNTLGYILYNFGNEKLHFYTMASSNAMLTFVVNYDEQKNIASYLARHIDLPESHTPFHQEINDEDIRLFLQKSPETIATYVESKVKTYGIHAKSGLLLCKFDIQIDRLGDWGQRIQSLNDAGLSFCFTSAYKTSDQYIRFFIVIDCKDTRHSEQQQNMILSAFSDGKTGNCDIQSDICLIYMQGPHFGDRHGIANQAFSALIRESVPILLAACVGATIYLVLPEDMMQKAKSILAEVFETP